MLEESPLGCGLDFSPAPFLLLTLVPVLLLGFDYALP